MAQSQAALGILDPFFYLGAFAEPRFDLDGVTSEVGDDKAVGVDVAGLAAEHQAQLLGVDGAPSA